HGNGREDHAAIRHVGRARAGPAAAPLRRGDAARKHAAARAGPDARCPDDAFRRRGSGDPVSGRRARRGLARASGHRRDRRRVFRRRARPLSEQAHADGVSARRSAPSVKQVAAFHEIIRQAGGKSSAGACRNRAVRLHRDTRRLSIRETDAFDLGWDHGIYRVAPDPDLPAAVREGYLAASGSREPKQADRFVRKWLQMRAQAMLRGIQVDATITPATLESLDSTTCPISGVSLTHGECADTDWSVDRVLNRYGYRPGNLLIVSSRVNRAKGALGLTQLRRIASNPEHHPELEPREWHRLAEVVEMFEIAEADDPPKGLPRPTGQLPVNGLRLSSVAVWQPCVTLA